MRISILALLVFFGLLAFQTTFAEFPFGGKIVALIPSGFCPGSHEEIVILGPRGGKFVLRGFSRWVTSPLSPPLPGRWAIGIANLPPPCGEVIIGGSSPLIGLTAFSNQLSFAYHSSTSQW